MEGWFPLAVQDERISKLFSLPRLIELRWLGAKRLSLFTSDPGLGLSDSATAGLDSYAVINPLLPDVVERRRIPVDRLFRPSKGQCSADADISHRILLPLDFDPVRETGTAATDAQRTLAAERANATITYLCNAGFPAPAAFVDSGNGRHVYFRFDAPNDSETDFLLSAFYSSLARRFDTADVKLDKSVRSAAQLMRLPGSFNYKARRVCELLSFTETETLPVTVDMIRRLTEELRGELGFKRPLVVRKGSWTPVLLETFLDFYNIDYLPPAEVTQGLLYVLNPCPLNEQHAGTSPAILLTHAGFPKFCCKHASCQMSWKQFRARLRLLTGKWFLMGEKR